LPGNLFPFANISQSGTFQLRTVGDTVSRELAGVANAAPISGHGTEVTATKIRQPARPRYDRKRACEQSQSESSPRADGPKRGVYGRWESV